MITLEQLIQDFQTFANNHLQIHSFGYGEQQYLAQPDFLLYQVPSAVDLEAVSYPRLYIVPEPRVIANTSFSYVFTAIVADRANKDNNDRIHIESDTLQILIDLIAHLQQEQTTYSLARSISIAPFIGDYADLLIGNEAQIILKVPFNFDACQIPTIT